MTICSFVRKRTRPIVLVFSSLAIDVKQKESSQRKNKMCCLFGLCCNGNEADDDDTLNETDSRNAVGPVRMARNEDSSEAFHVHAAGAATMHVGDEDEAREGDGLCCRLSPGENNPERGIHGFLRKLHESWRKYDSLETNDEHTATETLSFHMRSGKHDVEGSMSSPLHTASEFDLTKQVVPTIRPKEVVLPGSSLQKEMSEAMSVNIEEQGDECVICMEGFDETNPRMPTVCGCGENKTYFHLPCLYQWIEQSQTCPSCRQSLRWEEF